MEVEKVDRTDAKVLFDRIPSHALSRWDRWDSRIIGPVSMDEIPEVLVLLKNKDGSIVQVKFCLGEVVSVAEWKP